MEIQKQLYYLLEAITAYRRWHTQTNTHTRGHTHCVMYDSSGCVIRHQVNSRAVTNRQRKERVTYL